jgi:hypothetical protein
VNCSGRASCLSRAAVPEMKSSRHSPSLRGGGLAENWHADFLPLPSTENP